MGLSFSGIKKELASERFKSFYSELKSECPPLNAFPSPSSLISFFHNAENKEYGLKDSILSFLIAAYQRGEKYGRLAPLFITLFSSAIASVYGMSRKMNNRLDDEEFFQDVCVILLSIIREATIAPQKVAMQITDKLKNETWRLVKRNVMQSRLEVPADMMTIVSLTGSNEDIDGEADIPDAYALLDELVQRRFITKKDKKIIISTVIEGKSLRDVSDPIDYEGLKKRRQRTIFTIKKYLANKSKLQVE